MHHHIQGHLNHELAPGDGAKGRGRRFEGSWNHDLLWSLTSYWTTSVFPLLSIFFGNLAEMA